MDYTGKSDSDKNEERRKRVFVGKLPSDFLRVANTESQTLRGQQIAADAQTALALQHRANESEKSDIAGKLSVTIAQAKLVKNYGITRMDPYVTMKIGQFVYETQVDMNGGKNPRWNRVIHCCLPRGVKTVHVKVYDECSLKVDELIAWAEIVIPPRVFKGEPCDDWFPLSGRQGERVEGMINLIMNFIPGDNAFDAYSFSSVLMSFPPTYGFTNLFPPSIGQGSRRGYEYSIEDLRLVEEMFPNMDKDVVRSVFEANKGNKGLAVNVLLQMSN